MIITKKFINLLSLFKVSKMTTKYFYLFKVSKMTTKNFNFFKVIKMTKVKTILEAAILKAKFF